MYLEKIYVVITGSSQFHITISNLICNQTAHIQVQTARKQLKRDASVTPNPKQWHSWSHSSSSDKGGD